MKKKDSEGTNPKPLAHPSDMEDEASNRIMMASVVGLESKESSDAHPAANLFVITA